MSKILIIGCTCSGKTKLSIELHKKYGNELIHLDDYYFNPDGSHKQQDIWIEIIEELSVKEDWIIEGYYSDAIKILSLSADSCFFLDVSRFVCFCNFFKRSIKSIFTGKYLTKITSSKNQLIFVFL